MRGPGHRGGILAAMLAAGLVVGGVAVAQEDCVGLEVTPARVEQDLRWSHDYDTTVRNCTDEPLEVTTSVTALGHDLDGAPEFFDSSSAEDAVQLGDGGTFTLQPGTHRTLAVEAEIAQPARSLYAGVVAEFQRVGQAAGTSIDTRSRVAGMLLMRGPKPWKESVSVVDISLTPNEDGTFTVHAALENTGNVHVAPKGEMVIEKNGTVLDTVPLGGGIILPGFKRRLVGLWSPQDEPDGRVKLNAEVTDPPARGSAFIDFTEGEAALPAARITSLVASDTDGAYIEVTLRNIGKVALTPTVEVVVTEGEFERARMQFPQSEPMAPDTTRTVTWEPDLADATYRVTARAVQDDELLDEKVTGLRIGAAPPAPDRGGMPVWVVVLASLLLLIVLAALMFVLARKKRRDDREPPAPLSPARELTGTGAR